MSEVVFSCPNCAAAMGADTSLIGSLATCPNCEKAIKVPPYGVIPGSQVGDFVIERRLGVGGMGEVWLATQQSMQRKVALKILSPELNADEEFIARFTQEVKMAGKLIHPNIVTAYYAGEDNGIRYLAITYIDGEVLEDKLAANGQLPEVEALKAVKETAIALQYAWDRFKILHRDIKPANIMINSDGQAMLMDLGISKIMGEDASLTMTGTVVGTPNYMSPEQAKADSDIDFRSDLYALGGTLYHLLTGEVPYQATTAMGIIAQHITEPLPDCQKINPDISAACKALIERMMAKDREQRYASWQELIDDIDLVLKGHMPGVSAAASASPKSSMKGKLIVGSIAAVFVIMVLMILALAGQIRKLKQNNHNGEETQPDTVVVSPDRSSDAGKPDKAEKTAVTRPEVTLSAAQKAWNQILAYEKSKPEDLAGIISRCEMFLKHHADSTFADDATNKIKLCKAQQAQKIGQVMTELRKRVDHFVANNNYKGAMRMVLDYRGPYANETVTERRALADEVRQKKHAYERTQRTDDSDQQIAREMAHFLGQLAASLIAGKPAEALDAYEKSKYKGDYPELRATLSDLTNVKTIMYKQLQQAKGEEYEIKVGKATVKGKIKGVKADSLIVSYKDGPATMAKKVPISELPAGYIRDKLRGNMDADAFHIVAAGAALRKKEWDKAARQLGDAGVLGKYLVAELRKLGHEKRESAHTSKQDPLVAELATELNISEGKAEKLVPLVKKVDSTIQGIVDKAKGKRLKIGEPMKLRNEANNAVQDATRSAREFLSEDEMQRFNTYMWKKAQSLREVLRPRRSGTGPARGGRIR